jgi:hypothetical protein
MGRGNRIARPVIQDEQIDGQAGEQSEIGAILVRGVISW